MKLILLAISALLAAVGAQAQVTSLVQWRLTSAAGVVVSTHSTQGACDTAARALAVTAAYSCPRFLVVTGPTPPPPPPPPACTTPQPAAQTQTVACPAGTTGSWTQTNAYIAAPAPTCWVPSTWLPTTAPAGACVTPPPPPPPPPPPTTGVAYYFSDCQAGAAAGCVPGNNANAGTSASAPKQNLANFNVNTLPAGASLLFKRGGAWTGFGQRLENLNATVAAPLTFDAYDAGPAPLLQVASGNMFNIGGGWGNQTNDGGYVIRNLKLDGMGTAEWGVWFVQNVNGVILENNEITGFRIAINSNDGTPYGVSGITLRNNNIHRNRAMGMLGHYDNMLIEGNLFEANNFTGSTFDHAIYLGGGTNITIRNNRLLRNSVVNGVCQGGNMTFHGQFDGLLIEGNRIEQDAAASQCWLMSMTQGYSTAEWFRNAIVRNNKLINGGNTGMAVQSAPGVVIEGNVAINTQASMQTSFAIGSGPGPYADGDAGDANAIVLNNTACQSGGATGAVVSVNSPGAAVTNNVTVTGAAATTGVCAR